MEAWSLKLVAAAVLALSGAAMGRSLAVSRRMRAARLNDIGQATARLGAAMLERMMPLKEALEEARDALFAHVALRIAAGDGPYEGWLNVRGAAAGRGGALAGLEPEDMETLERLFRGLGATFADGQRLLLAETGERLATLHDGARARAEGQARLYTSLGLLAGLSLAVILL